MDKYEARWEELKKECFLRRDKIFERYKNMPLKEGLDANWERDNELRKVSIWLQNEINKARKQNGLPLANKKEN